MSRHLNELSRRKTRLKKSIGSMLAATAIVAVGVALAWFVAAGPADISELGYVSVTAINSKIRVKAVNKFNYTSYSTDQTLNLTLSDVGEMTGLGYQQTNGDDTTTLLLYKPQTDPFTGEPVTSGTSWKLLSGSKANTDYLDLDIDVKSNLPGKVYLSSDSTVLPVDLTDTENYSTFGVTGDDTDAGGEVGEDTDSGAGSDESEESTVTGQFSADYAAAATRVSVAEVKYDKETLRLLWAPNKNVELIAPKDEDGNADETAASGWTLDPNGTPETSYSYYTGTGVAVLTHGQAITLSGTDDTAVFLDDLTDTKDGRVYLGTFDEFTDSSGNTYYKCSFKVRVWLEGCDREAKTALTGGRFQVNLVFHSIPDEKI